MYRNKGTSQILTDLPVLWVDQHWFQLRIGSRVLVTENCKILQLDEILFFMTFQLQESIQPAREHPGTWKHGISQLFLFLGHFCPPGWILIQPTKINAESSSRYALFLCVCTYSQLRYVVPDLASIGSPDSSVADMGCLSRIRFFHPGSRVDKIPDPDPGSRGSKKHRIPDPQHWRILFCTRI